MGNRTQENSCDLCIYKSFVFDDLTPEELAVINISKKELDYKAGELIVGEGQEIREFLYLKSGLVKLHKHVINRQDQIINIAKPLDFIGLLSVFSNHSYLFSITAIEPSSVCFIDMEIIKRLIRENGGFATSIINKMSTISDQVLKGRLDLAHKNLRGRIAYIFKYFSDEIYASGNFELPVSRKELGELIDMRTENVVRILSEFRKDGVIGISGKKIVILDPNRLRIIAEAG
jgi:CRP/FNR family transcriptional regulator